MSIATKASIQTIGVLAVPRPGGPEQAGHSANAKPSASAGTEGVTRVDFSQSTRSQALPASLTFAKPVASIDSRYTRFVEAVQALRIDVELSQLSREQVDRIMQSAQRVYIMNDGVPEPVVASGDPQTPDSESTQLEPVDSEAGRETID